MVTTFPHDAPDAYLERLRPLHDMRKYLLQLTTVDDLCRQAVEQGCARLGFDRLAIWFVDGPDHARGSFGIDAAGQVRDERQARLAIAPSSPIERILRGDTGVVFETEVDLLDHTGTVVGHGMQAIVPLWDGLEVFGCIRADNALTHAPITPADVELLTLYASIVGNSYLQKRGEAEPRVSELRYQSVVEDQTELISRFFVDGTFIFANEAYCRFFGKTHQELVGKQWQPIALPEDVPHIQAQLATLAPANPIVIIENRVYAGEGQVRWMQFINRGYFDAGGELVEIQSIGRVITEHKQAEEALQESEARYRLLAENVSDVIWVLDLETQRFRYVSPSVERLRGFTADEVMAEDLAAAMTAASAALMLPQILRRQQASLQGHYGPYVDQVEQPCKDGSTVWVEMTTHHLINQQTGRVEVYGVSRDVTARKQAETYQRMAVEVLGILNQAEDMPTSIEAIQGVIKQFTAFDAVGIRLQDGDDYPYFVQQGFTEEFVRLEDNLACRGHSGEALYDEEGQARLECTCGLVLSGRADSQHPLFTPCGSFCSNDTVPLLALPPEQDPREHPRNRCIHEGYRSVALIPIRVGQQIVGLLQLNDRRPDRFTPETIEFFEGLSASIGVALTRKRDAATLRESESLLRSIFRTVPIGICLIHERVIQRVNTAWCQIFGYAEEQVIGKTTRMLFDSDADFERMGQELYSHLYAAGIASATARLRRRDDVLRDARITMVPLNRDDPNAGALAVVQDTTESQRFDETMQFIANRGWIAAEEDFFTSLVRYLGSMLEKAYVLVGSVAEDGMTAETVAIYAHGDILPNFCYALPETPCATVAGKRCCVYPENVRHLFPTNTLLREMAAESYIGLPLWDAQGHSIGLIAIIDTEPLAEVEFVTALLQIVATRAAGELERRRSEAILRESEERFRAISTHSHQGICIVDEQARVVWVNDQLLAMGGYSREQMLSTGSFPAFIAPESADFVLANFASMLACEPYEHHYLFSFLRADGAVRLAEKHMVDITDRYGTRHFVISMLDITEHKQAEEALRESKARLDLALQSAGMGIWQWDMLQNRRIFDDQAFRMLGLDPATFTGMASEFYAALHPDDRETVREALERAIMHDVPYNPEYRALWPDGTIRFLAAQGRVVRDNAGDPIKLIGVIQDITARKALETETALLHEQLIQAQKLESIGRLAGGVAHDFNNMLGVIIGHAELAAMNVPEDTPLGYDLQQILATARRSADLTRQLLTFARKQVVRPEVLNLNDTVTGMLKMLQRLIGENIALAWQPGTEVWPVMIDPSQVDQILANLAVNARDAIAGVGKVVIETANFADVGVLQASNLDMAPGDYVRTAIRDDGCGMDAETVSKIFDPFFTTKGVGKGTGLGLATVFGIVKQNAGGIEVQSELGVGTTFQIYLPRADRVRDTGGEAQAPESVDATGETVLVVEDEPAILRIARLALERQGYTVLSADAPAVALRLVQEYPHAIHLLLTDLIMPDMHGQDLATRIKQMRPGIRCLFMSGYTADIIADQGILDEGLHFLAKPFTLAQLIAAVQQTLEDD
jgi:two-component system cell cycle sensor histidine kinase/response regulator CckA